MAVLINMYVWGNGEGLVRKGRGGAMGKGKGVGLGLGRVLDNNRQDKNSKEQRGNRKPLLVYANTLSV